MAHTPLKRSFKIHSLATDLGLKASNDPVREIVRFCDGRIRRFLRDFPDCFTLEHLLQLSASKLGTFLEEIHSDEDLSALRAKYLQRNEKAFASLHDELPANVFGVTFKRLYRKSWELPYVSVIDCRGDKRFRSYYTKWHELGHLLILTDQMRLTFRRTHFGLTDKDPEEALVDVLAGSFGFLPDIIRPHAENPISFEEVEAVRLKLCPEASFQSSLIGITKAWPSPCILLQAEVGLKRGEQRNLLQQTLTFSDIPKPALRAVQVGANDAARAADFVIYQNMRVPERSLIHAVFAGLSGDFEAIEDLAWWQSSDGQRLPQARVRLQVKKHFGCVHALIVPA